MNPTPMKNNLKPVTFRHEFEKAFEAKFPEAEFNPDMNHIADGALWAAKWMAERCAELAENQVMKKPDIKTLQAILTADPDCGIEIKPDGTIGYPLPEKIRQLGKSLDE